MSSAPGQHLTKLVALAQERSSDKRRELLRDVSELFLDTSETPLDGGSRKVADDILVTLAQDMEASVKAELAERFADRDEAPVELVNNLAKDVIDIARPLLERSRVVRQETLVQSVRLHGAAHARVVAARDDVSEAVSEAIAETRDDNALVTLASNANARLSRVAMEHLVDHAETCRALHEPLVGRDELAPDLLNEMFFIVKGALRERILERNADLSPEALEEAFAAAQKRMEKKAKARPSDYDDAVRYVASKKLRKRLDNDLLIELLMKHDYTKFAVAFSELAGLTFEAAWRVVDSPSVEPLLISCRATGFSRDDFVRIAMVRPTTASRSETDSEALGDMYDAVDTSTAERVLRFVKLRESAASPAA